MAKTPVNGNGHGTGVTGAVSRVSARVIEALPGQMLLMLLLNVCFIGALFWLLTAQNNSRERVLIPLLEACTKTIPLEALPHGLVPAPRP